MTHARAQQVRFERSRPRRGLQPVLRATALSTPLLVCFLAFLGIGCTFGCAQTFDPRAAHTALDLREVFPCVRADANARVVEFDADVAINCHHPKTPKVYLELVACTPDTREHESLVVTRALPSHIHAALLLAGLEPGAPGRVFFEGREPRKTAPTGPRVYIEFVWRHPDGREQASAPEAWIVNARDGTRFEPGGWVFSGSRIVPWQGRDFYDADGTGTIIGLTTFGSETISPARVLSPESSIDDPEWIADVARVPTMGTPVRVRITAREP